MVGLAREAGSQYFWCWTFQDIDVALSIRRQICEFGILRV
jgi:hypothetical protein